MKYFKWMNKEKNKNAGNFILVPNLCLRFENLEKRKIKREV
jgi:hypothetical protein